MAYKPLFNKVLLQEEKENTPALVVEPNLQDAVKGIVVEIGIGNRTDLTATQLSNVSKTINKNDRVWFFIRDAKNFKIGNEEFYLIDEEDILVVEK